MAVDVYAFPPVGIVGSVWYEDQPISRSESVITGKRYISAWERPRRKADLTISSLALGRNGAGYLEVLRRLLEGGQSLVRLYSQPINRVIDAHVENPARQSSRVILNVEDEDVDYQESAASIDIFFGRYLTCTVTTDGGFPAVAVTGLAPSSMVARPGEFLTVFEDVDDTEGESVMVMTAARSSDIGAATIRVMTAPSHGGRVCIGTEDTGVFEVLSMPPVMQGISGDWQHTWKFREVFEDEVDSFNEVDPWT